VEPHPQQARVVVGVVVAPLKAPLAAAVAKPYIAVVVPVVAGAARARPGVRVAAPVWRRAGAGVGAAAGIRVGVRLAQLRLLVVAPRVFRLLPAGAPRRVGLGRCTQCCPAAPASTLPGSSPVSRPGTPACS